MKVQIERINYTEAVIQEMQSTIPTGFISYGGVYADCVIYLDSGDKLHYELNLSWDKDFRELISKIKEKVSENIGKINA